MPLGNQLVFVSLSSQKKSHIKALFSVCLDGAGYFAVYVPMFLCSPPWSQRWFIVGIIESAAIFATSWRRIWRSLEKDQAWKPPQKQQLDPIWQHLESRANCKNNVTNQQGYTKLGMGNDSLLMRLEFSTLTVYSYFHSWISEEKNFFHSFKTH